jgi:hypothetical protein
MSIKDILNGKKSEPNVITGNDPKNRLVILKKKGEKFIVEKPATSFVFEGSEKKAKEIFEHQTNCSHN